MPPKFQVPEDIPEKEFRLPGEVNFGATNWDKADTLIGDGQSPYMPNMTLDDGGYPTKRKGQAYVYTTSLGSGKINGKYKELFNSKKVFSWVTGLYTQVDAAQPVSIMSGLSNAKGYFYTFNDVLYYKNGTNFISISSSHVASAVVGYIPTLTVGRAPTGGGTVYEYRNLIQPGFIDSFTGNGSATAYTMSYTGLDATPLVGSIDSGVIWDRIENTHFTVNRTTGIVTWTTAPGSTVNGTKLKAYKTFAGDADKINGCLYVTLYGGATGDSRVFVTGNSSYKNYFWYTGLTGSSNADATYFPEFNYNRLGSDAKAISGWSELYQKLLAIKEDGTYTLTYTAISGVVTFPATILNRKIGCDMPGSIQVIRDKPIFFNTVTGGHIIVSTLIEDEKNIEPLSALINNTPTQNEDVTGLLDNSLADLQACTSVDNGEKYILNVGSLAYVWDYGRSPYGQGGQYNLLWYYWTNINASCWAFIDRVLYYGDNSTGQLVKFVEVWNDFGSAINGVWRMKLSDLGLLDWYKVITYLRVKTRSNQGSSLTIKFFNDNGDSITNNEIIPVTSTKSFSFNNFSFAGFTFKVTKYAPTIPIKLNIKDVIHIQIEFLNNVINQNLSILGFVLNYALSKKVK